MLFLQGEQKTDFEEVCRHYKQAERIIKMSFYSNLENGMSKLNDQIGELKDSAKGIQKTEEKKFQLTPAGRRAMNADAYALGNITLEEFIRREKEATFSISREEWNELSLAEQNKLYEEHPEKIRKLLGD